MVHHHHSEEVDTAALSTKAAVYAALILQDADAEITPDKINAIVDAAGIEEFEPIYSKLMAKALAGKDIASLLFAVGGAPASGPAPAASGAPAAAEAAPAAAEEKKGGKKEEKKKQEEEEEEEGDMGFGLF
ncbi:ribosomal protein LP1, partial [Hyaloraphidium curvatum]